MKYIINICGITLLSLILMIGCKIDRANGSTTNTVAPQAERPFTDSVKRDSIVQARWDSIRQAKYGLREEKVIEEPVNVNRVAVELGDEILARYDGLYELRIDPSHVFTVSNEKGHLYFQSDDNLPIRFFAESDTVFFNDAKSNESLTFSYSKDIWSMVLINKRGQKITADKVK